MKMIKQFMNLQIELHDKTLNIKYISCKKYCMFSFNIQNKIYFLC